MVKVTPAGVTLTTFTCHFFKGVWLVFFCSLKMSPSSTWNDLSQCFFPHYKIWINLEVTRKKRRNIYQRWSKLPHSTVPLLVPDWNRWDISLYYSLGTFTCTNKSSICFPFYVRLQINLHISDFTIFHLREMVGTVLI